MTLQIFLGYLLYWAGTTGTYGFYEITLISLQPLGSDYICFRPFGLRLLGGELDPLISERVLLRLVAIFEIKIMKKLGHDDGMEATPLGEVEEELLLQEYSTAAENKRAARQQVSATHARLCEQMVMRAEVRAKIIDKGNKWKLSQVHLALLGKFESCPFCSKLL